MSNSFKEIMISAISGMIVYGALYELFVYLDVQGSNNLETILIRIGVSLVVAIVVLFIVFGLVKRVKRID